MKKYRYAGSGNGKYCIVMTDYELSLYDETEKLWSNRFEDPISSATVANNGAVLVATANEQFYIFLENSKGVPTKLNFTDDNELVASGMGQKLHISDDGKLLAFMRAKRGIKGFLSSSFSTKMSLIFADTSFKSLTEVQKLTIPEEQEKEFVWNIAPDFESYILTSRKTKSKDNSIELDIYKGSNSKPSRVVKLKNVEFQQATINRHDCIMLHVLQDRVPQYLIISKDDLLSKLPEEKNCTFYHLARGFILFEKKVSGALSYFAKSFNGTFLTSANLSIFKENNVDVALLFHSNDRINLVYIYQDRFYKYDSDIQAISTEVSRFEIMTKKQMVPDSKPEFDYYTDYYVYNETEDSSSEVSYQSKELEALQAAIDSVPEKPKQFHKIDVIEPPVVEEPRAVIPDRISIEEIKKPAKPHIEIEIEKPVEAPPIKLELQEIEPLKPEPIAIQKEEPEEEPKPKDINIKVNDPKLMVSILSGESSPIKKELQKIERLLNSIEERYMLGEISEKSYKELKLKYQKQLNTKLEKLAEG